MDEKFWHATQSYYVAAHAIQEERPSLIVIVGPHGSGKTQTMSVLSERCAMRPVASLSSCHPSYRESFLDLFFTEVGLLGWKKGGIVFADEYDDTQDICRLVEFVAGVEGILVASCHPENQDELLRAGSRLGRTLTVPVFPLGPKDARAIWQRLAAECDLPELAASDTWSYALDRASGSINHFLFLALGYMRNHSSLTETWLTELDDMYVIKDKQEQEQRAVISYRGYTVRYADETVSCYWARGKHWLRC